MTDERWSAGRSAGWLLPFLLALLPAVAYAPAWWQGRLLGPGDGAALHYPLRSAVWEAYRRGELPAWNPDIFLGTPLLAAYRPGALYPPMAVLALLPDFTAFQLLVLLSLSVTGPLMYAYVRRLGGDPVGAYLAGLSFSLGPYLVGHVDDTATLVAAPLLPLLLLCAERWLERETPRRAAALALGLALLLLAGSPEAARAGLALLAGRLLVAWLWPGRLVAPSPARTALVLLAGLLLAAPQLVPTLWAAREAGRPIVGLATVHTDVLPGATGLILRYASHTPAPALALAAVPLMPSVIPVRVLGSALLISLALQWGRGPLAAPGALALVFDLTLAVLAGLSLSAQWRTRNEPFGRRLRGLFLATLLVSSAALSIAAAAVGPVPEQLAGAVGTLALSLILYFGNAGSPSAFRARLWLLPLTVSFALQPYGRRVWETAPRAAELEEGTGTRQAIDRTMGARASEPVLTLVRAWPGEEAGDLAYANWARLAGRRSANGYDPMVSLRSRHALGSMSAGGILPEGFFRSDPGRLEILGLRWTQVPGSMLRPLPTAPAREPPLHLIVSQSRFFPFPMTAVSGLRVVSSLLDGASVRQDEAVARVHVRLASGRGEFSFPLRAGVDTAEWAWDRPDVSASAAHRRPPPSESWSVPDQGFAGHHYAADLSLPGRYFVDGVSLEPSPGTFRLQLARLFLVEAATGRAVPVAPAALYVSDAARFREAAATPLLRLFELRASPGPARVAARLHVLRDESAVLDALSGPLRYGIDPRRDALASAADVGALALPTGSKAARAELLRRGVNRLEARAEGPGLLVLSEGWDRGWRARLDDQPARLLRVNHAQMGVLLPAPGMHRVVLRYRPPGWAVSLALCALAASGLAVALGRRTRA